ncbi:MAG: hypothetical protein AAB359_00415, partial [Elusimicrobiota bacterium]
GALFATTAPVPPLPAGDKLILNEPGQVAELDTTDGTVYYRPPNNFLLGNDTVEIKAIDIAVFKGSAEVGRFPLKLRRPPVILVHGLIGDLSTFPDTTWKTNSKPLNTIIKKIGN